MAAAIRVTRWFAAEARRVYAVLDESDADRELRHVEEWIDRRGGTACPRDVAHGMRRFRGETDRARAAIDRLVEAGRARWEAVQNPRGGPTSQRVRLINPDTVTETRFEEAVMEASGDGVGATKAVEERSKPC